MKHLPQGEQATWRTRLQRAYQRPTYAEAQTALYRTTDGTGDPQAIGGPELSGRPGGNVDLTSAGGVCPLRPGLQDDELSGVDQCLGGGAVRQGGSVDELPSAAALVGHRVAGDRAAAQQGKGLSALAPLAWGPPTRIKH